MLRGRIFAAIITSIALVIPGLAQAAPCAKQADQTALQVRMLQTELMVAALTCNQRTDYNSFVTRFKPQLSAQGKHLQVFFKTQYGAASSKALNGFITKIANESSRRGMMKRGAFCRNATRIHADSVKIKPASLTVLAETQPFAGLHGISACPTKVAAQVKGDQPVRTANP